MKDRYVLKRNIDFTGKIFSTVKDPVTLNGEYYECEIVLDEGLMIVYIPKAYIELNNKMFKKIDE